MSTTDETLSTCVHRSLEDLRTIRDSLVSMSNEPGAAPWTTSGLPLDLELASQLKALVDTIRQLLWAYMAATSPHAPRPVDEMLSYYKMEIAIDLLRCLRGHTHPSHAEYMRPFEDLINRTLAIAAANGDSSAANS